MPRICFTSNLKRHVECPDRDVEGEAVRATLEAAFAQNPSLKSDIIDDQGNHWAKAASILPPINSVSFF